MENRYPETAKRIIVFLLTVLIGLAGGMVIHAPGTTPAFNNAGGAGSAAADGAANAGEDQASNQPWIIKWRTSAAPDFTATSQVMSVHADTRITIAKPLPGQNVRQWRQAMQDDPRVQYITPDATVQIQQAPNDPGYDQQNYLQQIHAPAAWDIQHDAKNITIAIVDTGVDLNHPDLKNNLVAGTNLINPGAPPQDDNGHGTNVAGIIAAQGNNSRGVAGIAWNAKIMPIKALEADGQGDEDKLGQGIRYAVDHGANIIELSVGLYSYSPYLQEVCQYAEDHNVLLVAATGNDGKEVEYPAAFPTVLAVGGVDADNKADPESDYGPELDVVAPFTVYTTALGGGYMTNKGTSMSAPQVAGVAALILARHPGMKPYQVRNLIMQTAQDIGPAKGWNPHTGYGLIRADLALKQPYKPDMFKPDNSQDLAKPLPLGTEISAELTGPKDQEWFSFNAPYDGTVTFTMNAMNGIQDKVAMTQFAADGTANTSSDVLGKTVSFPVKQGGNWLRISADGSLAKPLDYVLTTGFQMSPDPFEPNDHAYSAYQLPAHSMTVTGNFDHINDNDWYKINVPQAGVLQVSAVPDTARMDLALTVQKAGDKPVKIDMGLDGQPEVSPNFDVTPGEYDIMVQNVNASPSYPVIGQYALSVVYSPKYTDPGEPNDKPYQAVQMSMNTPYSGLIATASDQDWFTFTLKKQEAVDLALSRIPKERLMSMELLTESQQQLAININNPGVTDLSLHKVLDPGTYYVRLTANKPFDYQQYQLEVQGQPVIGGFTDIRDHWAQNAILELSKDSIVHGYPDHTFRPEDSITRAEAAAMIDDALKLKPVQAKAFPDVKSSSWAYGYVAAAKAAGIIAGYGDGTFQPDQPITRAEMAVMLSKAYHLAGSGAAGKFPDVADANYAAPYINRMVSQHLLHGFPDGTFRPGSLATRAEFAYVLDELLKTAGAS